MRRFWILLALLAALAALSAVLPWAAWVRAFCAFVASLGTWGPVLFVVTYIVLTVLFVPGLFLSIGAGVAYGIPFGSVLVFLGATGGATAAFLVSRTMLRRPVRRWVESHPRLLAVDEEIDRRGWIVSLLVRSSPVLPFNVMNYALGATSLSLAGQVLGCFAMIPGIILYAALGEAVGDAAVGRDRARTTEEWVFLAVGILATVVVTVWLGRVAARGLPRQQEA